MSKRTTLQVLILHPTAKGSYFLISDPLSSETGETAQQPGLLHRVRLRVHDAYESLKRRFDYQENVCATLRHASDLDLIHTDHLTCEQAQQHFQDFLKGRISKHRIWFGIDLTLALLGALLTPIPGPNVFFLYPAARALSHYFALSGARGALRLERHPCKTDFLLTRIQQNLKSLDVVEQEVQKLERTYNIYRLQPLLEKL